MASCHFGVFAPNYPSHLTKHNKQTNLHTRFAVCCVVLLVWTLCHRRNSLMMKYRAGMLIVRGTRWVPPIVSESSERACGRICGVVAARGGVGRKVNGRQTKMREEEVGCCSVLRHSPISCSIRAKYLPPSIWRRCPRLEL